MTEDGKIVQGDIGYRRNSPSDAIPAVVGVWFGFFFFLCMCAHD